MAPDEATGWPGTAVPFAASRQERPPANGRFGADMRLAALPVAALAAPLAAVLAAATGAGAGTIAFAADDDILIVRGRDAGGDARFEFLAEGDARLQCVALDAAGKPLAVATTWADSGFVRFDALDIRSVDRVACRRQE